MWGSNSSREGGPRHLLREEAVRNLRRREGAIRGGRSPFVEGGRCRLSIGEVKFVERGDAVVERGGRSPFVEGGRCRLSIGRCRLSRGEVHFVERRGRSPFVEGGRGSFVEGGGRSPFVQGGRCRLSVGEVPFVKRGGAVCREGGAVCRDGKPFAICRGRRPFVERGGRLSREEEVCWSRGLLVEGGRRPFVDLRVGRWGGKEGRTMNFRVGKFKIQHDHMMSEFQRTSTNCGSRLEVVHSGVHNYR
jgi:hypothetical protein